MLFYESIPLLVNIRLLMMMQYDAIGAKYSNSSGCRDKARVERITRKAEIRRMEAVSDGPIPELHTDSEEEEPEEAEEPIEPGDRIFAIGLIPVPAEIRATSSVSQRLAKAFKRNSESTPSGRSVPEYLKEFDC